MLCDACNNYRLSDICVNGSHVTCGPNLPIGEGYIGRIAARVANAGGCYYHSTELIHETGTKIRDLSPRSREKRLDGRNLSDIRSAVCGLEIVHHGIYRGRISRKGGIAIYWLIRIEEGRSGTAFPVKKELPGKSIGIYIYGLPFAASGCDDAGNGNNAGSASRLCFNGESSIIPIYVGNRRTTCCCSCLIDS